jgi:hypothetical protein
MEGTRQTLALSPTLSWQKPTRKQWTRFEEATFPIIPTETSARPQKSAYTSVQENDCNQPNFRTWGFLPCSELRWAIAHIRKTKSENGHSANFSYSLILQLALTVN